MADTGPHGLTLVGVWWRIITNCTQSVKVHLIPLHMSAPGDCPDLVLAQTDE